MSEFSRVTAAADLIRSRIPVFPPVAVVLGSGLGDFAARLVDPVSIAYREVPGWPAVSVAGHDGRLVVGSVRERPVAVLAGRVHAYETREPDDVAFPVRVMGVLGVKVLILTNAAGGINTSFPPGALMVVADHLNLTGVNPLVGPNDERFGPRFPDMSEAYARRLRLVAAEAGREIGVVLPQGVYAAVRGPNYETPAEIRALRALGADVVGMSTVPETLVARQMGIEVLALSCVTNTAAGVRRSPLGHQEVLDAARRASRQFAGVLEGIVARL